MPDRTISYREAINEAIVEEMERDKNVILLGEDVAGAPQSDDPAMLDAWGGVLGVTKGLVGRFGKERVLDTPITESAIIGAATGAAATGLRPIAELMFVSFAGVCLDQIVNQAAKLRYMFGGKIKVPLTIRTTIGAGAGAAAQHSDVNYSMFAHYPGLKCVVPSNPADAKGLLKAAIRDDDPVIVFENKMLYDIEGACAEWRAHRAARKGVRRSGRQRCYRHRLLSHGGCGIGSCPSAGQRRGQRGGS